MIKVKTKYPIAKDSPDYIMPFGTRRDNSRNKIFNQRLYRLFKEQNSPIKILDLGCSGGGFVKDCIDDGHIAVGLEGSDWSKKHHRAEWGIIPNSLFTCDITQKYDILLDGKKMKFDVVTAWEVLEHIAFNELKQTILNIKNHLTDAGLVIMSISSNKEVINGVKLHQIVKSKNWWINTFKKNGLFYHEEYLQYFNNRFIRHEPGSFYLILSKNKSPKIFPKLSLKKRFSDKWYGSKHQTRIRRLLIGE